MFTWDRAGSKSNMLVNNGYVYVTTEAAEQEILIQSSHGTHDAIIQTESAGCLVPKQRPYMPSYFRSYRIDPLAFY